MPYSADSGGIPVAFPEPSPGFQAPCTRPVPDFRVTLGSHWGGFGLALGGFARLFEVWSSMFDVRCSAFTISILNTTPLSRLPRGGLVAA